MIKTLVAAFAAMLFVGTAAHAQTDTIFGNAVPGTPVVNDPQAVSLGVKFYATGAGTISGIRFYRGHGNGQGYTVDLYTAGGSRLAQAVAARDTCTVPCWESVNFSAAVAIKANTTYIAAYYTGNGDYAADDTGFQSGVTSGPLVVPAGGASGGNGVYRYGTGVHFPNQTYEESNYWVDVLFTPAGPPPPPPLTISFNPTNPNPICAALPGTVLSTVVPAGGDGNAIAYSITAGDAADFALSGAKVVVGNSGINSSNCGTTQSVTVTASQQGEANATASLSIPIQSGGGGGGSALLPPDRDASANWKMAGLLSVGGIPNRTTICATVNPTGGADDTPSIQSAINACPAGQVVQLAAGTFTINEGSTVNVRSGVSLRGNGPGSTILTRTNGATIGSYFPGSNPSPMVFMGGNGNAATSANLASDGVQGSYSVAVSSTSGMSVGDLVHVDELAIGQAMPDCCFNSGTGAVWAEPDYKVEWNAHNPSVAYFDSTDYNNNFTSADACAYSFRCGGVNEELHLVTAINGNTLTFDSPLTLKYRVSNGAQVHDFPIAPPNMVQKAGLEDMTVQFGDNGNVVLDSCIYCWVYKVESRNWLNGGIVLNAAAFRDQIDMNYVHDAVWPVNGGAGYGIQLTYGTSEDYIVNNIVRLVNKVDVVRASGAGVVFAYNYMDDGYINGSDGWVETGLNCSHLAGSHGCLFEGNQSFNSDSDFTHGNSTHSTYFRNWMTGFRAPFTAQDGTHVDDTTGCCGPLRAIGDHAYSYWDSFIGNVAGTAGKMAGWTYRCAAGNADSGCAPAVFNLGWNDTSVPGSLADGSMAVSYPTQPTGTITGPGCLSSGFSCAPIVDGNYDYLTNSIQWASNDTAHTMPPSMYLTSAPAFFGVGRGYTWPWVVPEGAPQLFTLPAKARYDAGTPFVQP